MKYNSVQLARLHSVVVEVLMDDEESQVRGFVHVNDEEGLTMSHLSMWSFSDMRCLMNCIQVFPLKSRLFIRANKTYNK